MTVPLFPSFKNKRRRSEGAKRDRERSACARERDREILTGDNNLVEAVSSSPSMARVSKAKRGPQKFVELIIVFVKG